MKKLIITADDYGMSLAVNRAIEQGIEIGLITATNVMTNMDYYREAIKLKETSASIGIHWTLSCGKPVTNPEEIKSLIGPDGYFYKYSEFRKRYRKGLMNDSEIKKELINQYKRYKEILGEPDYWNTHQNVHVDFKIYKLFVDIAIELGILKMRSHQRIYVKSKNKMPILWRIEEPIKSRILDCWQNNAHKRGIVSSEGLIVCLDKDRENDVEFILENISWQNKNIGEYVIHPALKNDSPYFGSIVEKRIKEYNIFTSMETLTEIRKANIDLINFKEL